MSYGVQLSIRLSKLNKKAVDIIRELHSRGVSVNPSDFSKIRNEILQTPKAELVKEATEQILAEWEQHSNIPA